MQPTTATEPAPAPVAPPPVQTPAQRAAAIRTLQRAIGPARAALQRLDERLARNLRADRPYDRAAARRDVATVQAACRDLAEALGLDPPAGPA
jgi:hypothetical protein